MTDKLPSRVIDAALAKAATLTPRLEPISLFGVDSYLMAGVPSDYEGQGERVTIFNMGDGRRAVRRDRDGEIQILGPSHHPDGGQYIVGDFLRLDVPE
jgi:hypothetical protein